MAKRTCENCGRDFRSRNPKTYCNKFCDPARYKTCVTCEKSFFDKSKEGMSFYCSKECDTSKRKKICEYCDTPFLDDSPNNSMKFCEPNCRRKAKITRQAEKNGEEVQVFLDEQTYVCEHCGTEFTPSVVMQMYCTTDCRDSLYQKRFWEGIPDGLSIHIPCMECGEEFVGSIPHGGRSGNHFETKHGMTNQEYLEKYPEASIYSDAARWRMRQAERTFPENYSETLRQAQLKRYKRDIVWNKGFCKETHPSLTKLSESQKANALEDDYVNSFQGRTHSEKTKKILSDINKSRQDDYVTVRNWLESVERSAKMGIYLSEPHAVLIQALKDSGLWSEFDFDFERWVTIGRLKHGMDISTVKPFKFAIEVDGCYYHGCPTHTDLNKLPSYARDQINIQMNRDADLDKAYEKDGWILLRLWEHEVKEDLPSCIAKICDILEHKIEFVKSYDDVKSNLSTEISSILTKTTELVLDLSDKPTEEILDYYRHRGFPYYHYTSSKIKQDFESLCKYDTSDMMEGDSLTLVRKGLGMKAPNYFMRNFFSASKNKKPSMLEVFECDDMLKDVIESRKKYAKKGKVSDSTMRTGLRIRASAPSSFPSPLAKYVYERFIDKEGLKVLDPCAGFGGRMIGSQSLPFDVSYTGVDPWTENIENLSIMRDWFGFEKCDLIHSPFEKVRLHDNSFDFAFTSPPHYTKESYTREDTQSIIRYPEYKEWIDKFLKPLIFNTYRYLKPSSHLVLHVSETGDTFVQDCVDLMREAGFTIKDSFYWEIRNFMHKNQSSRKEPFLVGYKES